MDTTTAQERPTIQTKLGWLASDFYNMVVLKIGYYLMYHLRLSRYSFQYGCWYCFWCDNMFPRAGWDCGECCIPDKFRSISKRD